MGSAGIHVGSHYDCNLNLLCMVRGAKRVRLSPPSDSNTYGVFPSIHPLLVRQSPHRTIPDEARVIQAEIQAKECLFVPPHWWHYIENLKPALAISIQQDAPGLTAVNKLRAKLGETYGIEAIEGQVWLSSEGRPASSLEWVDALTAMLPKFVQRIGALCVPEVSLDYILEHIFSETVREQIGIQVQNTCASFRKKVQEETQTGMRQALDMHEQQFQTIPVEERLRYVVETLETFMIVLGYHMLQGDKDHKQLFANAPSEMKRQMAEVIALGHMQCL